MRPRGNDFLGRGAAQDFLDGRQQVLADDRVLLRFDAQARVLVGNVVQHGHQAARVFDILRIRVDRPRQSLLLLAPFLVRHVEHILQFRVRFKHALVEALDNVVAVFRQYRRGGFHDVLRLLCQHCLSPLAGNGSQATTLCTCGCDAPMWRWAFPGCPEQCLV
ncbi:hypothetical protein D3C81_1330890 [compost metagenome]